MRKLKILIIDPGITYGGWGNYGKDYIGSMINHGIAMITTVIQNAGYNVKLLDARTLHGYKHFDKELLRFSPDVVGIGFRTLDYFPAKKMIMRAKKLLPNIITIVGGLHVSIAPEDIINDEQFNKNVDYIILGEGEISILDLLDNIENNVKSERIIRGIRPDLDDLPIINREIYDNTAELNNPIWFGKVPWITMLFTRGCNYNCAFCQPCERILFGSKRRYRSVDKVIEELLFLKKKYRFKYIHFHDDNFIQNIKWIKKFIEEYRANKINARFVIQTRADLIIFFEDIIAELTKIGLDTVSVGFESGSDRVLRFLRKGTTVIQNVRAAQILKKYNLKIVANYMYGVPTETRGEMLATKKLIDAIQPRLRLKSIFTPFPGSDLYTYCVETGIYEDKKEFEKYTRNFGNEGLIKGIDYDFIYSGILKTTHAKVLKRLLEDIKLFKKIFKAWVKKLKRFEGIHYFEKIRKIFFKFY